MARRPILGIDLGTTCSTIGLVQWGEPRLLPVEGDPLMPSVVYWPEGAEEPVVGPRALNSLALDPARGIRAAKRWMGTEHRFDLGNRVVSPQRASGFLLERLVDAAWLALGWRPERLLVTVPAWFTHAQRAETRQAATWAGVEVVQLTNEPTAAALAHLLGHPAARTVLVYDLGGGTFDASLLCQDGETVEVLASHGDTRLGGEDIDEALTTEVLHRLGETDAGLAQALGESPSARVRLGMAVEEAKVELSQAAHAVVRMPFALERGGRQHHVEVPLDRGALDRAVEPVLDRTLVSVRQVLADGQRDPAAVDELLLVGGSTLLPQVWHRLRREIGLEGSHAVPPRLAVGLGAVLRAAMLDGDTVQGILVDVAPYSLSVGVVVPPEEPGDPRRFRCRVLTPRNAALPSRHTQVFRTAHPLQDELRLPVYQGSDENPDKNVLLGEILLEDLPRAPEGERGRPIRVELRHDLDGMVGITVTDELSGRTGRGRVAADGEERAELRRAWRQRLAREGVVCG